MKPTRKTITRKEALKKAGGYAAFTAAASMFLLHPRKAMATSPEGGTIPNPGWGSGSMDPSGGYAPGGRNSSRDNRGTNNSNKPGW